MTTLIRASSLNGFRALVSELGGSPDYFLQQFDITPTSLGDEVGLYPLSSLVGLLEVTAKEMDCPNFGLRLSEKQGMKLMGPVGVIGFNSPTVGDALNEMLKHLHFHSPALLYRLDSKIWPGKLTLVSDIALTNELQRIQIDEGAVGRIYQEFRGLTNGMFIPEAILFRHSATMPISAYRGYFRAPVFFEQDVNGVVFNPEVLNKRVEQANPQLHKLAVDYVREASEHQQLDVAAQVRFLVRRLLPTKNCGIAEIARRLFMHERTLQRKLKNSGFAFEEILDSVRHARAEEQLKQSKLAMAQIAESLGYIEQASFNRACLRWFGTTPTQVRRQTVNTSPKQQ